MTTTTWLAPLARVLRVLPGGLLKPVGWMPRRVSSEALVRLCNQVFATALRDGQLDFLRGQRLQIRVEDAALELGLSHDGKRLLAVPLIDRPDLSIGGRAYEFLLLVTRREDADTLFFQRRLKLGGSTELGLYLKNFLDAWEPPAALQSLQRLGNPLLGFIEEQTSAAAAAATTPAQAPRSPADRASSPRRPR